MANRESMDADATAPRPAGVESAAAVPLDLDLCAREPIHVPGGIQPSGWLFSVDEEVCVDAVSANVVELLERRPGDIFGADLAKLLGESVYDVVGESRLRNGRPTQAARVHVEGRPHDLVAHVGVDRRTLLELEAVGASEDRTWDLLERVETESDRVLSEEEFERATSRLAEAIRRLTGFDRITVYRFDETWSGEVVAEDGTPEMDRYLGLRFPASDIPAQARRLYAVSPIRVIFDARASASPLLTARPAEGPIDLSRATLRAVSPVHLRYLENMQVRASMSISLMHEGQLWGLIACHDRRPMHPSVRVRRAAAMIGRLSLPRLVALDPRRGGRRRGRSLDHLDAMMHALATDRDPLRILGDPDHGALPLVPAEGLVVRIGNRTRTAGVVPEADDIEALLQHLDRSIQTGLIAEHRLVEQWPAARTPVDTAAGVMAIRIGRNPGDLLAWVRPEQPRVVNWAGDPRKPAIWDESGVSRLQPRESFEAWREDVRGQSEPWMQWEIDVATRVRGLLLNIIDRFDAYDTEQTLRHRAEDDFARARTDLVRQRRAVLAMLADAAESGGDAGRLGDIVTGPARILDRLASAMGRREEMVDLEERLADLERLLVDPSSSEAPARVRELRRQVVDLLDLSAPDGQQSSRPDGLSAVLESLPPGTDVAVRRPAGGGFELQVGRSLTVAEADRVREAAVRASAGEMDIRSESDHTVVTITPRTVS